MTVEDTVTKSSSGQIGGPRLWRVSHKGRTTHSPPNHHHRRCSLSALPPIRFPLSARPHRGEGRRGLKCLSESARPCPASVAHVRQAGRQTHKQTDACRVWRTFVDSIQSVLNLIQIWTLTLSCWLWWFYKSITQFEFFLLTSMPLVDYRMRMCEDQQIIGFLS